jgi:hypothetical protein
MPVREQRQQRQMAPRTFSSTWPSRYIYVYKTNLVELDGEVPRELNVDILLQKGTANRTQQKLELEIENMGAHLNAYTSVRRHYTTQSLSI